MNNNKGLVTKDTTLMEYSPKEMAFVEYNPAFRQRPPSVRDELKVLFRHKLAILMTFLTVMAVVYIGLQWSTPLYEARVKLLIRAEKLVESPYYRDLEGSFKTEAALTQSEIVKSNPVMERTVKALKLDERPLNYEKAFASALKRNFIDLKTQWFQRKMQNGDWKKAMRFRWALRDLRDHVKVKPISNTNLFSISARDFDPAQAAAIANAVSRYYVIFDLEQQWAELQTKYGYKHQAVMQLREEIQKFEKRLNEAPSSYIEVMGPASVKILEEAPIPTDPVGFPPYLIAILAAASGLCLGVAMAFLFERLDTTLRSTDDVANYLNLPLLGSVPARKFGSRLLKNDPLLPSRYAKSFEGLADQMHVVAKQTGVRSILMTASASGEGTSLVTANLGVYLSKHLGYKVLLIDSNIRHPMLHRLFKIHANGGFSDVLGEKASLEAATRSVTDRLDVLPAGPAVNNPLILFDVAKLAKITAKAREKYEIILVDSAHLKDFKDAEVLSAALDGVVLIVEAGRARRHAVRSALSALEQKKVNLLGVVLNKRIFDVPQVIYEKL